MPKLFCPHCGQEMVFQNKLYGQYRFHDTYYGCKSCDKCWEVNRNHTELDLKHLSLSEWLQTVAAGEKEKERQRLEKKGKEDA